MAATSLRHSPVERTTAAALEEKKKLQKHCGRFDMLFFLICTLVGLDTIGAVAKNGGQGFTWLIFLGIFFFIPYALLTAELGTTFPEEGGPYAWPRLAFGRLVASVWPSRRRRFHTWGSFPRSLHCESSILTCTGLTRFPAACRWSGLSVV